MSRVSSQRQLFPKPSPTLNMHRYDEAFPNSEQLFHRAFALSSPVPELLALIEAHPTHATVRDLLIYYIDAVEDDPSRANELTSALTALRDFPEAPILHGFSLAELFSRILADLHSQGLDFNNESKTFSPTNPYLIASLLSGLSLKYQLTSCADQYGSITDGLYADGNSSSTEVLVIGACIQLLTYGSGILPRATLHIQSANEVEARLKAQKSMNTVINPNALRLLEVCKLFIQCKT